MYLVNFCKLNKKNDVFVERVLPFVGYINTKEGQVVEPFTKLGLTKMTLEKFDLGKDFVPVKGKSIGSYFYVKEKVGVLGSTAFTAPFAGYLNRADSRYYFEREPNEFWLLSGVWGEVKSVSESRAVLLKTQVIDINLAVSTDTNFSGELIVFPNPDELLVPEYLEKFMKTVYGTVLYIGSHVTKSMIEKAIAVGAVGVIGGGVERDALTYGREYGVFVGGIMGYGNVPTPDYIFDTLKSVSNRHVFLNGATSTLRVPVPARFTDKEVSSTDQLPMKYAKKGVRVMLITENDFAKTGIIEKVGKIRISVRLEGKEELSEFPPEQLAAIS